MLSDTTRAVKTSCSHATVIKKKLPDIQILFNILCYSVLSSTCADILFHTYFTRIIFALFNFINSLISQV